MMWWLWWWVEEENYYIDMKQFGRMMMMMMIRSTEEEDHDGNGISWRTCYPKLTNLLYSYPNANVPFCDRRPSVWVPSGPTIPLPLTWKADCFRWHIPQLPASCCKLSNFSNNKKHKKLVIFFLFDHPILVMMVVKFFQHFRLQFWLM